MSSQPIETRASGATPDRADGGARHREFGRFVCQERLAGAAPFELWRARTQGLAGFERAFAVKVLPPGAPGTRPDAAQRLLEVAARASALRDPRLAQVVESGIASEGEVWVASEYVFGATLGALSGASRAGETGARPSPALLAHLGAEVATALAVLHGGQGATPPLPHGALTPSNVALTTRGQVKVVHAGLREAVLGARGATGQRNLSPYAAPELLLAGGASREADVFALGALLFELATGKTPPSARNPRSASELGRALDGEGIPADLREALLALVKADPGQRPTATAAAERLRAACADLPEADLRSECGALARRLEPVAPRVRETGAQPAAEPARAPVATEAGAGDEGPALGFAQVPTRNIFRDNPLTAPRRVRAPSPRQGSTAGPLPERPIGHDDETAGGPGRRAANARAANAPARPAAHGPAARALPPEFGAGSRRAPAPEFSGAARVPGTVPKSAPSRARPTPRSPVPVVPADPATVRGPARTPVPATPQTIARLGTPTRKPDAPATDRARLPTPRVPIEPSVAADLAPTPREYDAFQDPPAHARTITSPGEPLTLDDLEEISPESVPELPRGEPAPAQDSALDMSRLAASEVDALFAPGIRDSSSELARAPQTTGDGRPLVLPDPDAFDDFAPESRAAPAPAGLAATSAPAAPPRAWPGPEQGSGASEPEAAEGPGVADDDDLRPPRARRGPVIVLVSAAAAALLAIGLITLRGPSARPGASTARAPEPEVVRPLLLEPASSAPVEPEAPEPVPAEPVAAAEPAAPTAEPTPAATVEPAPAAAAVTTPAPAAPVAPAAAPVPAPEPQGRARRNPDGLLEFELTTDPPGAEIWVNGGSRGLSPATVALRDRHRKLVLIRPGFATYETELDHATLPAALKVTLEPTPPWPAEGAARVSVECERAGQYPIRIDGVETGLLCPMEIPVSAGRHTVEVYVPWRFKSYPVKVDVAAGQTVPVRYAR